MTTDADLLAHFVARRDAAAFAGLVNRYLPLVYAAARRRVGDPALADDVSQAVFLVLADKAAKLDGRRPLADWLLVVTRYAAANALRQRGRRAKYERAAAKPEAVMPSPDALEAAETYAAWATHLDAALDRLSAADRQAILLRFYDAADFATVATTLNVSEATARKRVTRAVEKLRSVFARRGVSVPAVALAAALPATLALTPPPALAASIPVLVTSTSFAAAPAAVLAKGTLKAMLVTKIKTAAAATLAVVALAGTGTGIGLYARAQAPATQADAVVPLPTKPVVGWLKIEMQRGPAWPLNVFYLEPSTGRRLRMSRTAEGGEVIQQSRDPLSGVSTRYLQETNQFVIGTSGVDEFMEVVYTEKEILTDFAESAVFRISARPAEGGERVIDLLTTEAIEKAAATDLPNVMEMHTDVATGVVKRITAMPSKDGKTPAFDALVVTPVAGPPVAIDQPEKMKLPAGATLIDNRPSPEIRELLEKLEDVVQQGPGFDVGVIVRRSASAYTGEFYDDSADIKLCAGTADRFVIASWRVGKDSGRYPDEKQFVPKPAGWPTPTLPAVLEAVGQTRPHQFVVFDGKTCWTSNDMIGGSQKDPIGRTVAHDKDELWRNWSIAGQLWGRFPTRGSVFTKYTLKKDKEADTRVTLEAVTGDYFTYGDEKGPRIHKGSTIRMWLATDLGPYPLRVETIRDGDLDKAAGRGGSRMIWDIEQGAKWMFRDPVRVPEHWRRLSLDDGNPSLPEYYRLIPYPDGIVPDEWFQDPAKTWPVTK